jgi:hypothetical protein
MAEGPTTPTPTGGVPYKLDFLVAIVSFGIPFGWSMIGFPPNVILGCCCWAVSLFAVLHYFWAFSRNTGRFKRLKWILIIGLPALILVIVWKPVVSQYHIQHSPPIPAQKDTNALVAIDQFRGLTISIRTNQSDPRLAVLDAEKKDAVQEGNELQKKHELFNLETVDLKKLREERENELAQKTNAQRQAEIQQAIDDIKNKQQIEDDAKLKQQKQQEANEELIHRQKVLAAPILPIFDCVITGLDKMLVEISNGGKRTSDFPSSTATIYASDLEKDGRIINGTNSISIGTNDAWNFEISTALIVGNKYVQNDWQRNHQVLDEPFASITIMSRTTNGESVLTVTPYYAARIDFLMRVRNIQTKKLWANLIRSNLLISAVSIKLTVPNGLNMDENHSTNYVNDINKALHRLIGAQDQQCPLKSN